MQYSISFSSNYTVGFSLFMLLPITCAYYQALRCSNLSAKHVAILGLMSTFIGLSGLYLGCVLIGQSKEACLLDLITILGVYFLQKMILKRGPTFFYRHFFYSKEQMEEELEE